MPRCNIIVNFLTVIAPFVLMSILLFSCRSSGTKYLTQHNVKSTSSTNKQIALGRKLFFDKRLSINNSVSCATCHNPKFAFTDRLPKSRGVFGRQVKRNAPSILNSAISKSFMFDAHIKTLEEQVIVPIQEHTEMGIEMRTLIRKLNRIPIYRKLSYEIFKRSFDPYVLTRSIASFERSLNSRNNRFDQFFYGKRNDALSIDEKKGWRIFSEKLKCTQCHVLPDFTNYEALNNGTYKLLDTDKGRYRIFGDSADIGKFKVPSLRNIELTYPYMHDGSLPTLYSVIDHYENGGRKGYNKSNLIKSFKLSVLEKKQLVKFLKSLTDTVFLAELKF